MLLVRINSAIRSIIFIIPFNFFYRSSLDPKNMFAVQSPIMINPEIVFFGFKQIQNSSPLNRDKMRNLACWNR